MTVPEIVEYLASAKAEQRRHVLRQLAPIVGADEALTGIVVTAIARAGLAAELSEIVTKLKPQPPRWTKAAIARLGQDTDTEIARDMRLTVSAVARMRRRLGIPRSPHAALAGRSWTAAEDRQLGTMPDRELAGELGISVASVERRRVALGVEAYRTCGRRRKIDQLAGAKYFKAAAAGVQLATIARKHAVSRATVAKALARYQRRRAQPIAQ